MAVIGVNYAYALPAGGGYQTLTSTAPTAAIAFYINQLIAQLTAADGDTTCTITHNWNLSAAAQANLLPNISYVPGSSSAGTVYPNIAFTVTTNTITVAKTSAVGSNTTVNVTINRPTSLIQ